MGAPEKFENKPLAGLSALRGKLPPGPERDEPAEADVAHAADDTRPGAKLVVQREKKKRGGKTVTRIRGLELTQDECAGLARELARALGCGASLEDREVVLQGDQVKRAATWLREHGAARVIEGN